MNMISTKDAAKEFDVSRATIQKLCRDGKLNWVKLNAGETTRFTMIFKDEKYKKMKEKYKDKS